jgi:Fuc2NAc and GlcNAc transferase
MHFAEAAALLISMLAGASLTRVMIAYALRRGLVDVPNARSSHKAPTPRGGGLAVVATVLLGVVVLCVSGLLEVRTGVALIAGGAMVAFVGYVDDRRSLPAAPRFVVHIASSVLLVFMLLFGGAAEFSGDAAAWIIAVILTAAAAWSTNLFNFMDGIDGIAGSQAVFVTLSSALLTLPHAEVGLVALLLTTAGACIGFLVWNWPPARIFMGDVGSGFLGFWLAALALLLHVEGALSIWTSLTLSGVFLSDATVTLLRRIVARKRWYEAHRSHAYQRLARHWGGHLRVTALVWAINLVLVLPLAFVVESVGSAAPLISGATLALLALLVWAAGAGTEEAHLAP